jgi:hypothetical protein
MAEVPGGRGVAVGPEAYPPRPGGGFQVFQQRIAAVLLVKPGIAPPQLLGIGIDAGAE